MVITERDLIGLKEVEVHYGIEAAWNKRKMIKFERMHLVGIHKILVDGFTLRFIGKRDKEKAVIVLKMGEGIEILKDFGEYRIIML